MGRYDDYDDHPSSSQLRRLARPGSGSMPARPSAASTRSDDKPRTGVTDLLGKLRIEQRRHAINQAMRGRGGSRGAGAAETSTKGKGSDVVWLSTRNPSSANRTTANGLVPSYLVDQPANTPAPSSSRLSGRRTAGPPAPLSWRSRPTGSSSAGRSDSGDTPGTDQNKRKRTMRSWREGCLARYWNEELLPYHLEVDGSERSPSPIIHSDEECESSSHSPRSTRSGAPTLVTLTLRLISRHISPPNAPLSSPLDDTADADRLWLEHQLALMRPEWRVAIMEWGIHDAAVGVKGIEMVVWPRKEVVFLDEDPMVTDAAEDVEEWEREEAQDHDDWERDDTSSPTRKSVASTHVSPLPLLDLSTLAVPARHLKNILSTPLSGSLRCLSLSYVGLPLEAAVKSIPDGVGARLECLALVGLEVAVWSEWERAVGRLRRWGARLEYLDISESFPPTSNSPHPEVSYAINVLTSLLDFRSELTQHSSFPALKLMCLRGLVYDDQVVEGEGGEAREDRRTRREAKVRELRGLVKRRVEMGGSWFDIEVE